MPYAFTIPGAPAELLARINARRERFAPGVTMGLADPDTPPPAGEQPAGTTPADPATGPGTDDFKSEESKRSVLADLAAEREARKELQRKIADMEGSVGVLSALRQVLAPDGKPDPQADLAAQVAELRRERDEAKAKEARMTLAATVAAASGVTDIADVALIAAQAGEDAMRALAARLKGATPGPGTPKPDPSAGHSGDPKPRNLSEAINQHYRT